MLSTITKKPTNPEDISEPSSATESYNTHKSSFLLTLAAVSLKYSPRKVHRKLSSLILCSLNGEFSKLTVCTHRGYEKNQTSCLLLGVPPPPFHSQWWQNQRQSRIKTKL